MRSEPPSGVSGRSVPSGAATRADVTAPHSCETVAPTSGSELALKSRSATEAIKRRRGFLKLRQLVPLSGIDAAITGFDTHAAIHPQTFQ